MFLLGLDSTLADDDDDDRRPLSVFFGNLTPDVEDLRFQHMYHPVPVEEKSPALASVLDVISNGLFGDEHVYEPYVFPWPFYGRARLTCWRFRLLNTIRQGDYYLLTDDFDSCMF